MDSLTQFTLGAVIGVATLGRRIGPRKAALTGGIVATVPDLDVFLPASDPIDAFVNHRGWSHSLITLSIAAPVLGEGARRLFTGLKDAPRWVPMGAVWLMLTTHALLDAMTVYGTKLFWPLSDHPFGLGSMFIIDPLYTIPLLVVTLWALSSGTLGPKLRKAATIGLVLSTVYAGWSAIGQQLARDQVVAALEAQSIATDHVLVTPMPFTTVLWRGVAVDGDRYVNVYRSLLDDKDNGIVHVHPRNLGLREMLPDDAPVEDVAIFSKGYYALGNGGGHVLVKDLRMGVTPNFVFTFKVAEIRNAVVNMVTPVRLERTNEEGGLEWLWARMFDETVPRIENSLHQSLSAN